MIGSRLKGLREEQGLSQRELAKIIQVSSSTVAMYELDQRSPDNDTVVKLANYFNVTTDYLLGRTDNPTPVKDGKLQTVEEVWPEAVSVLLRAGRKPTLADRRRIAKIMEVAIEYTGEDEDDL